MMQASKADRVATRAMHKLVDKLSRATRKVADKVATRATRRLVRRLVPRQLKLPIHRQEDLLNRGQTKLNPSVMATVARTTFHSEPIVNL